MEWMPHNEFVKRHNSHRNLLKQDIRRQKDMHINSQESHNRTFTIQNIHTK